MLLDAVNLKPTESQYKVGIIVAADRMNERSGQCLPQDAGRAAAPVRPDSADDRAAAAAGNHSLALPAAELRGEGPRQWAPAQMEWLAAFSEMAAAEQKSLLGRYRLMDVLLRKLNEVKESIEETLTARSPLEKYEDAEENLAGQMGGGTESRHRSGVSPAAGGFPAGAAMVAARCVAADARSPESESKVQSPESGGAETEARGQTQRRGQDRAMQQLATLEGLLAFPQTGRDEAGGAADFAEGRPLENLRVLEQLQRWLRTNVQEALALEVGLLKLRL